MQLSLKRSSFYILSFFQGSVQQFNEKFEGVIEFTILFSFQLRKSDDSSLFPSAE